jgi:GMP synthase-like glutamine amidotransferase
VDHASAHHASPRKQGEILVTNDTSIGRGEPDAPPMCIGVIETGELPAQLVGEFADYPEMVSRWLAPFMGPADEFRAIRVVAGEALGSPSDCDGYVITGSRFGVYDPIPWLPALEAFILACGQFQTPVFGICFGHQLMAKAYGADVKKSARGWGCGIQSYNVLEMGEMALPVSVFHQDQVLTVPEGARIVGGNEFCPIGMLDFGRKGRSVQFHPEFQDGYCAALLELRTVVPQTIREKAKATLQQAPDVATAARWAASYFAGFRARR